MGLTALKTNGADLNRLRSDRQRRFVLEYLLDRKPQDAAIRAGYSKRTAAQQANKLLNNPIIKAYLGKLERLDVEKLELDRHEVLRQLWYALTRQAKDFFHENGTPKSPHELPEHCQSIIDGFEAEVLWTTEEGSQLQKIKYKLTPHAVAREQAMKHKGLFPSEKHDHKHEVVPTLLLSELTQDGQDVPDAIEEQIENGD